MKKWVCPVCGYVHEGENPPAECPVCHVDGSKFIEQKAEKSWAAEHVVGVGKAFGSDVPADVQKEIEAVRAAGQVGSSLQAEVEIRAAGDNFELLTSLGDDLRFVLICSKATVVQVASDADAAIVVTPSAHKKCERCWHYRDDVGHDAAHPELCGRCTSNLYGTGEARSAA